MTLGAKATEDAEAGEGGYGRRPPRRHLFYWGGRYDQANANLKAEPANI